MSETLSQEQEDEIHTNSLCDSINEIERKSRRENAEE